jgi:hypothetical protein
MNRTNIIIACVLSSTSLVACASPSEPEEQSSSLGQELSSECPPPVPTTALEPPSGNALAFHLDATGVQIYACKAVSTGYDWVFQGPEANLYGEAGELQGTHFAGPTWKSIDGSAVVAAKIGEDTPDATAIPWLLLEARSNTGSGRMARVSYIQRLETVGGLRPTSGCDAEHAGAVARVPYEAVYYFYKPSSGSASCR